MKQRLGVAVALLGDPPILMLDEPMNGLDPEGMVWFRGLVRNLRDEGRTVLLSSHLMRELEGIADRVVVINHGRIAADAGIDSLLGEGNATNDRPSLEDVYLRLVDPGRAGPPMTSAAVRHPQPSVVRAEWTKTLGSRGTLVAFGLLAALPVAFSALVVANTPSTDPPDVPGDDDIVANALVGGLVGVVVAAVVGATSIGNEERSGMISTTYTATPRRHRVILSKAFVAVAATLVIGVVSSWSPTL